MKLVRQPSPTVTLLATNCHYMRQARAHEYMHCIHTLMHQEVSKEKQTDYVPHKCVCVSMIDGMLWKYGLIDGAP